MDKRKLAREIAARSTPRFIDIPREKRQPPRPVEEIVAEKVAMGKRWFEQYGNKRDKCLEAEQQRLLKTWSKD